MTVHEKDIQPHIVCENCHLFMTPACDEQDCRAFTFLYELRRHLEDFNKTGGWVGQTDSRRDAFNYVIELIQKGKL